MWLTGFYAPTVSTMYLDKPMKDHTLMQTDKPARQPVFAVLRRDNKMDDRIRFCRDNKMYDCIRYCRVAVTTFGHEGHEFSSSRGGAFANTNRLTGHVWFPALGHEIMAA